jgi:hypothetical protein
VRPAAALQQQLLVQMQLHAPLVLLLTLVNL